MKKLISLMLILAVLPCISYADTPIGHGDLAAPSEWARSDIAEADAIGMLDYFKVPWTIPITREQFCNLAYNMLDVSMNINWKKISPNPFDDTDNEKVISLYLEDIIEGKENKTFAPDDELTREEAAVILYRIAEYAKLKPETSESILLMYADDEEISDWAKDAVYNLYDMNIMNGTEKGFEPQSPYTVEQSIATLMRLYRIINPFSSFEDKINAQMPSDKNYMFSPLSIQMALAMAANGAAASSDTQKEILSALDINDLKTYNENTKNLIEKYSASDLLQLNVSNSIWINTDNTNQKFSKEYESLVKDVFGATSDTVTKDNALEKINGWVSEKTKDKIPTIIGEDGTNFWAMLINAVYFKGRWQNEFNKNATSKDTFTDRNGKESQIDFMHKTFYAHYSDNNGIQIIELPYLTCENKYDENGEYVGTNKLDFSVSMYLMMSDNDFNPVDTLNNAEFSNEYIDLSMPKFNIEYNTQLNDILKNIGINRAFEMNAEFGNMFDSGNMWLTDVIHKTYINVDEEGTEAAAVTAVGMGGSSLPPEPLKVDFNKPFTFVIRDNTSGNILFMGEYAFAD